MVFGVEKPWSGGVYVERVESREIRWNGRICALIEELVFKRLGFRFCES